MKVLIAGATGVLGRRLVQQLRDRGHNAIALVRSAKRELESHLQNYPVIAVEVVLNQLSSNNHSVG